MRSKKNVLLPWLASGGFSALVASFLLPNHYPPWTAFHQETMAFAGLLLLTAATFIEQKRIVVPKSALAIGGLACIPWIQHSVGLVAYAGDAWLATLYLIGFALAIVIGATTESSLITIERISKYLVVTAALSTVLAFAQWQRQEDLFGLAITNMKIAGRPFANLAQPNHLATLAAMGAIGSWVLFERKQLSAPLAGILGVMMCSCVIMTGSRTGFLSIVCFIAALSALRWRNDLKIAWRTIGCWGLGFLLAQFAWAPLNDLLLLSDQMQISLTSSGRSLIWMQLTHGILAAPWMGHGWRQTAAAMAAGSEHLPSVSSREGLTDYAHNIFLDIFAWFGLPIGILLSLALVLWIIRLLVQKSDKAGIFPLMMTIPFLLHCLTEYPFAYAYFLIPMGLLLGLATGGPQIRLSTFTKRAIFPAFLLVFGIACLVFSDYVKIEQDYRISRFSRSNIGKQPPGYIFSKPIVLDQLKALIVLSQIGPDDLLSDEELASMKLAIRRHPSPVSHLDYVLALARRGLNGEARENLNMIGSRYGKKELEKAKRAISNKSLKNDHYREISLF